MPDQETESLLETDGIYPGNEHIPVCRICHEDDYEDNLFQPCRCTGTMKWVHMECLNQWRSCSQNSEAFNSCMECNYTYNTITNDISRVRCCRCEPIGSCGPCGRLGPCGPSDLIKFLSRKTVIFYALNQIFIIAMAMALHFFDQKRIIAKYFSPVFGLPLGHQDIAGWLTGWNYFKYPCYYVLSSLSVVAIWILVFIINLIFMRRRGLYLALFFKGMCQGCSWLALIILFCMASIFSPLLGTVVLTISMNICISLHYTFMDQLQATQSQIILPYRPESQSDSSVNTDNYIDSEVDDDDYLPKTPIGMV